MSIHQTDNIVENAFTNHPLAIIGKVYDSKQLGLRINY